MEKMTVLMVQMKWDAGVRHVRLTCLHARMESAFHLIGVVTLIVIAVMAVMRKDVVSIAYIMSASSVTVVICLLVMLSVCTAELLNSK
jgi:uncharacterized membrane protein